MVCRRRISSTSTNRKLRPHSRCSGYSLKVMATNVVGPSDTERRSHPRHLPESNPALPTHVRLSATAFAGPAAGRAVSCIGSLVSDRLVEAGVAIRIGEDGFTCERQHWWGVRWRLVVLWVGLACERQCSSLAAVSSGPSTLAGGAPSWPSRLAGGGLSGSSGSSGWRAERVWRVAG